MIHDPLDQEYSDANEQHASRFRWYAKRVRTFALYGDRAPAFFNVATAVEAVESEATLVAKRASAYVETVESEWPDDLIREAVEIVRRSRELRDMTPVFPDLRGRAEDVERSMRELMDWPERGAAPTPTRCTRR